MPKKNRRKAKKAAAAKAAAAAQGAAVEGDLKTKGAKAYQRKDFKTALELFSKAIEETPEDYKLYSNRAATHYFLNAYAESLQDAKKCIELKSDWHKGYMREGMAYEKLLQYPEAKNSYAKGLEKAPEDPTLIKLGKAIDVRNENQPIKSKMGEVNWFDETWQELLDELKLSEQESAADNPEGDRFSRLIKWMKDGGCKFPKLYMKYYTEDYRGVHTLCNVPADDMVLYVPRNYIMTTEMAKVRSEN